MLKFQKIWSLLLVILLLSVALTACGNTTATPANTAPTTTPTLAPVAVEKVGLLSPESVLYDSQADVYLGANVNGDVLEADNNGFINQISPDGRVLNLKWISGGTAGVELNGPKGMAIVGDILYVADITVVRKFDRRSGAPKGKIEIPGAVFLNDLANAPDGSVYVSDTGLKHKGADFEEAGSDAVYRISPNDSVQVVAKSLELGNPNGLYVLRNGKLVVVTLNTSGEVYTLDASGKREVIIRLPAGQLDGVVELDDNSLLVSSWASSSIYRIAPGGNVSTTIVEKIPSPADIGLDTKRMRLLVPVYSENRLLIIPLK